MDGEIGIALTIPLFGVGKSGMTHDLAVHHLFLSERERTQRLREQLVPLHANRYLPRLRTKQWPRGADDVANVEQLEHRKRGVAELVATEIELNLPGIVGEMGKCRLTVPAPCDQSPRDAHRRPIVGAFDAR